MEELSTFKENNFRAGDSTLDSRKVYTKDLSNGYKVDLSGWTHTRDYAGFLTDMDQTNPQALVYGLEANTRYSYNIYQYFAPYHMKSRSRVATELSPNNYPA